MGRVLTNTTSFRYGKETSLGTGWSGGRHFEINSVSNFGANISTVTRNPIDANRQRLKGSITTLESSFNVEHDLTMDTFEDFIGNFLYSRVHNDNLDFKITAVGSSNELTVEPINSSTITDETRNYFKGGTNVYRTLVKISGLANNSLNKEYFVQSDMSGNVIEVLESRNPINSSSDLTSKSLIQFAGFGIRAPSVNDKVSDISINNGILSFTLNDDINPVLAGKVKIGQFVCFGSSVGQSTVSLESGFIHNGNKITGLGRLKSIDDKTYSFDKLDTSFKGISGTLGLDANLDIYFGKYVKNVPVDNADYLEESFVFEAEFPKLGNSNETMYQYSRGNYCSQMTFNLPLADKATMNLEFMGTDTDDPVETRISGPADVSENFRRQPFNTTSDIAKIRIQDIDNEGLSTYFKSLTLTLNNNVSAENVLGKLGAQFLNLGNLEVGISAQMHFTHSKVIDNIRSNGTVSLDFALKNNDGGIVVDIPAMVISGGNRDFPENETVLINVEGMSFADPVLNSSMNVSTFAFLG